MDEALIAAVRQRPALYDKACDNYSNRQYVTKQWTDIAQELGQEAEAVRKRWSRLRHSFQRNHKQLISLKSGSPAGKGRKMFLYDALSFLIPFLAPRPTNIVTLEDSDNGFPENASVKSPSVASVESTIENMFAENDEDQPPPASHDKLTCISVSDSRGTKKRKSTEQRFPPESFDMEMMETLKDLKAGVLNSSSSRSERLHDEDVLYCLSLVPKMRNLDTLSRLECQAEMNHVLIRYIKRTKVSANEVNSS